MSARLGSVNSSPVPAPLRAANTPEKGRADSRLNDVASRRSGVDPRSTPETGPTAPRVVGDQAPTLSATPTPRADVFEPTGVPGSPEFSPAEIFVDGAQGLIDLARDGLEGLRSTLPGSGSADDGISRALDALTAAIKGVATQPIGDDELAADALAEGVGAALESFFGALEGVLRGNGSADGATGRNATDGRDVRDASGRGSQPPADQIEALKSLVGSLETGFGKLLTELGAINGDVRPDPVGDLDAGGRDLGAPASARTARGLDVVA